MLKNVSTPECVFGTFSNSKARCVKHGQVMAPLLGPHHGINCRLASAVSEYRLTCTVAGFKAAH
jgi:hypothetical protein